MRTKRCSHCLLLAITAVMFAGGCGYTVARTFPSQVQTVAVPVFENETFRTGIDLQLTEAVQREVKDRTIYRLAKESAADTRLRGTIVNVNKNLIGENRLDDPRQLEYAIAVRIVWEDLRTGRVLRDRMVPVDPSMLGLNATAALVPETGQSKATAQHTAVKRMAEEIVDLMEFDW